MVAWQRLPFAFALIRAREYERAAAEVDLALTTLVAAFGARHPTLAIAYMYRAQARSKLGRLDEAVADARLAVDLTVDEGDSVAELARVSTLGNVLGDAGDRAGAIELYERILANGIVSGVHAGVLLSRGYTRMELGDHQGAIADARAARAWLLENDPGDITQLALAWGNEAAAWHEQGACDEARRVLEAGLAWARATGKEDPVRNLVAEEIELRAACADAAKRLVPTPPR
jgi:tetratricopeptide (TPR) repeat protein